MTCSPATATARPRPENCTACRSRLTPDVTRGMPLGAAEQTATYAVKYAGRGIAGLGLGGSEASTRPEPYARAFDIARSGGLGSVPHAGEVAGPESVRGALDVLHADRLRHGIRAIEDPGLVRELAERGDRTRRLPDLEPAHQGRRLARRSIRCRRSSRPASPARCRQTTRPCSART